MLVLEIIYYILDIRYVIYEIGCNTSHTYIFRDPDLKTQKRGDQGLMISNRQFSGFFISNKDFQFLFFFVFFFKVLFGIKHPWSSAATGLRGWGWIVLSGKEQVI